MNGGADGAAAAAAAAPVRQQLSTDLHYAGLYIAGEAVSRGKRRVDVSRFGGGGGGRDGGAAAGAAPVPVAAGAAAPVVDRSGGWMLRYENDNTEGDAFFDSSQSRLTFMVDYPNSPSQEDLMWIKG